MGAHDPAGAAGGLIIALAPGGAAARRETFHCVTKPTDAPSTCPAQLAIPA